MAFDQGLAERIRGTLMNGYVFIDPPGFEEDEDLQKCVLLCRSFVN